MVWPALFLGETSVAQIMLNAQTPLHGELRVCADALLAWANCASGKHEIPEQFGHGMVQVCNLLGTADARELYELSTVLLVEFDLQENDTPTATKALR